MIAIKDLPSLFIHWKLNKIPFVFILIEAIIIKLMYYISIIRRVKRSYRVTFRIMLKFYIVIYLACGASAIIM